MKMIEDMSSGESYPIEAMTSGFEQSFVQTKEVIINH